MSFDFEARKKTLWLAFPTGILYLARNRYTSVFAALVMVFSVGAPISYYLIFVPQTVKLSVLAIITTSTLAFYCFSYLAIVFKVEFPAVYASKSTQRWHFESCLFLLYAVGSYVVVNLELIRDLFITKHYLHGGAWIGGFLSLLPFAVVIFFRIKQMVGNMSKK